MSSCTILVVDNELDQVMLLEKELEALQFTVVGRAKNAHEAVELTGQVRPDLVLMDIRMGSPSGIRAAAVIWQLYLTPVLFVTDFTDERQNSLGAGAFGFLRKPRVGEAEGLRVAVEAALYNYETFNVRTQEYNLALFALNPSGRLLSLSKSSEKLWKRPRVELVGRGLEELLAPESMEESRRLVKRAVDKRRSFGAQINIMMKGGQRMPLQASYKPVFMNGDAKGISIRAWQKPSPLNEWPDWNRRRLELIEKKYRARLEEVEANELEDLQEQADNYVEPLGEIDPDRLKELRVIYENLKREEGHERGEA